MQVSHSNPMGVGGGVANYHGDWIHNNEALLRNEIDFAYAHHDPHHTGLLEGEDFYQAYHEVCEEIGHPTPNLDDTDQLDEIARQADINLDGKVSKGEMFDFCRRYHLAFIQ